MRARARPLQSQLLDDGRDEDVDRPGYLRRHLLAHPERRPLDAEHDDPARRPAERTSQLERVDDPQRVRRGEPQVSWQPAVTDLDAVQRPRWSVTADRVDHDHHVESCPEIEQPRGLIRAFQERSTQRPQPIGDERPHGVVAAERAAEADGGCAQSRSTLKRRKCVAHEMHGS